MPETVPVYETEPPEHEKLVAHWFCEMMQVSSPHVPVRLHVAAMFAHPAEPDDEPELPDEEPDEPEDEPELPDEELEPPVVVVLEHAEIELVSPTKATTTIEKVGNLEE